MPFIAQAVRALTNAYCNKYAVGNGSLAIDKRINARSQETPTIYVTDSSYTSADAFKQAMSGVFLYYELATEQVLNIDANGLRY